MNNLRTGCLTIDIKPEFHQIALSFAKEQDSVEKGKQVYLNTLAVLVLREFLEESSFATDLDRSDSWNPLVRCFHNVADLVVDDLGKIECLPIVEDTEKIPISETVGDNPIAYVVVLLSQDLDRAQLIGYTTTQPSDHLSEIETSQLQLIEDLIDHLFNLELANDYLLSEDTVATKVRERLQSDSISDIAAQFERIIRTVDKKQQQNEGVNILAKLMEVTVESELVLRSSDTTANPEIQELKKLAQSLLDRLQSVFRAEEYSIESDSLLAKTLQKWQQLYEQQNEVITQISAYLGDREETIIQLLRESVQIEDKYERSDRAMEFFHETVSSERNRSDSSANSIEMDDEKLLDLVEELWEKLEL